MNVDVHFVGWTLQIDDGQRMAALHKTRFVTTTNRLQERAGSHGSMVDEDMDVVPLTAGDVRRADPTAPTLASGCILVVWRALQRHQLRCLCTHDVVEPVEHVVGGWNVQERSPFGFEMEGARRVCESVIDDNINDASRFGFWTSLKGQSSWCVLEQVVHRNSGAVRHSHWLDAGFCSVFHDDGRSLFPFRLAGNLQA